MLKNKILTKICPILINYHWWAMTFTPLIILLSLLANPISLTYGTKSIDFLDRLRSYILIHRNFILKDLHHKSHSCKRVLFICLLCWIRTVILLNLLHIGNLNICEFKSAPVSCLLQGWKFLEMLLHRRLNYKRLILCSIILLLILLNLFLN